jgi:glycosyltransferase involved in cell wall biosynthesis
MKNVIGIDASRCKSGGAYSHLVGILNASDLKVFDEIHIWTHLNMLKKLPRFGNIFYHTNNCINGNLFFQLGWQLLFLSRELAKHRCEVLVSLDASTVATYKKHIVLSRDMLSYEPGIMKLYPWYSKDRIRLEVILFVQNFAFRRADGVVFLTQYAASVIQKSCGKLKNFRIIPHGISENFRSVHQPVTISKEKHLYRCMYISNADLYKNQWNVVEAISMLRHSGYNVILDLIGGGDGLGMRLLLDSLTKFDSNGEFVNLHGKLDHSELVEYYRQCDFFIYASSCENMPNTLMEAISAGIPIACSDRGPMPEILKDAGLYFDPLSPESIANAILKIINSQQLRLKLSNKTNLISSGFSWEKCSRETFSYILEIKNK